MVPRAPHGSSRSSTNVPSPVCNNTIARVRNQRRHNPRPALPVPAQLSDHGTAIPTDARPLEEDICNINREDWDPSLCPGQADFDELDDQEESDGIQNVPFNGKHVCSSRNHTRIFQLFAISFNNGNHRLSEEIRVRNGLSDVVSPDCQSHETALRSLTFTMLESPHRPRQRACLGQMAWVFLYPGN
jgi:hypothetical protein